jgi:hypothetical protein
MTKSNTEARLKYWKSKTPEEKSAWGTQLVKARWAKLNKKERSEVARHAVMARWKKIRDQPNYKYD